MTSKLRAKPKAAVVALLLAVLLPALLLCACQSKEGAGMKDGFYTAEAADFDDYGWKEYITLYVSSGSIVTVDYNAKNASGFIKSWDMEYMQLMNETDGTYPNAYTRQYSEALLNRQDPAKVDAIAGATHSYHSFVALAEAAMAQARAGDENVVFVELTGASGG